MQKFSVVVPLYNKETHIKRTIDSVLAQTVKDFELIIVDDGSTDQSAVIVKSYTDPRIRLIQQNNSGVSAARNRGIHEAKANYIAFLDADDTWEPIYLETISELTKNYPHAGIYSTSYKLVYSNKKIKNIIIKGFRKGRNHGIIKNFFYHAYYDGSPIHTCVACVPKKVFDEVGFFKENIKLFEDFEMWFRIIVKYSLASSSKICASKYNDAENRISRTFLPKEKELPYVRFLLDAINNNLFDKKESYYVKALMAKYDCGMATNFLLSNRRKEARDWAIKAKVRRYDLLLKKIIIIFLSYMPFFILEIIRKIRWKTNRNT